MSNAIDRDSAPHVFHQSHRYNYLIDLYTRRRPRSLIEIGVWRGERAVQFLQTGVNLERYVGFDLFDDLSSAIATEEKMGLCTATRFEEVQARIQQAQRNGHPKVELIAGRTDETMPEFASRNGPEFDFIYIDGGHSLETIRNDWTYSEKLLAPEGMIVFDDYYPNETSRGAKPMIDELGRNDRFAVRFFPMIEDNLGDVQITMASVTRRSPCP
jgi:Methyltransferase domain